MDDLARTVIRDPASETAAQYSGRVYVLGAIYVVILVSSVAGILVLVQWAHLFVTLTQRSNVETLTLLFFILFYAYFILISVRGAWGAINLLFYEAMSLFRSRADVEQAKVAAIGAEVDNHPAAALDVVLELRGNAGLPFRLAMRDEYGDLGPIEVDGARMSHLARHGRGSVNVFVYLMHQINKLLKDRGDTAEIDIVEWKSINDESMKQYLGLIEFSRNLERQLNLEVAWPKVLLDADECEELERRLSSICCAVRNEAFLPEWEYSGDHKLPLIPEPLGLFSLGRSEKRVDPVSSMGTAAAIVVSSLLAFVLFVILPPWVPGS